MKFNSRLMRSSAKGHGKSMEQPWSITAECGPAAWAMNCTGWQQMVRKAVGEDAAALIPSPVAAKEHL